MSQRVAVVGSGYVGTVVAACLAYVGHSVVGVEADEGKLDALAAGLVPFHEPGLQQLLEAALQRGTLRFTRDLGEAMTASDVVFLCVGTPPGPDGHPDMSAMTAVAHGVAANLRHYHVVVTKSTVPVGTGFWLSSVLEDHLGQGSPGALFDVVSNPEFLREGNAVQDYLHPDRVVLGSSSRDALAALVEVYRPILDQDFPGCPSTRERVPVLLTGLETAEMTKYASNAFLATKISFANEVARLCDFVGADVTEVTAGMGLDCRIGNRFLDAGLGWGGSCFGKDLQALVGTAREYGYRPALLEAAITVNEAQRQLAVDLLLRQLKTVRGARIGLLGLAFKADTDDLRDSPALDIARRLVQRGAFVTAYDPMVRTLPASEGVRVVGDAYTAALGADAIVLATEWPQFLDLDLARLHAAARGNLFLDGRNLFDPIKVRRAGFVYLGIGRPGEVAVPVAVTGDPVAAPLPVP
jgi:nucleotide sugar dehydrogenase